MHILPLQCNSEYVAATSRTPSGKKAREVIFPASSGAFHAQISRPDTALHKQIPCVVHAAIDVPSGENSTASIHGPKEKEGVAGSGPRICVRDHVSHTHTPESRTPTKRVPSGEK